MPIASKQRIARWATTTLLSISGGCKLETLDTISPHFGQKIAHLAGRMFWSQKGPASFQIFPMSTSALITRRVECYGRWTVKITQSTIYPPNLQGCAFGPDSLISEMDYAGVDVSLLHTNPMLGRSSAYLGECVRRYPDRLLAMAPVDEWRIKDDPDAVVHELECAIKKHGLHAIKFNPTGYKVSPDPWDDGFYRPFWESATSLGVPIFISLGTGPDKGSWGTSTDVHEGYLNELTILMNWMEQYPNIDSLAKSLCRSN